MERSLSLRSPSQQILHTQLTCTSNPYRLMLRMAYSPWQTPHGQPPDARTSAFMDTPTLLPHRKSTSSSN